MRTKLLRSIALTLTTIMVLTGVAGQALAQGGNTTTTPEAVLELPGGCFANTFIYYIPIQATLVCGPAGNLWHQSSIIESTVAGLPDPTLFPSLLIKITDGTTSTDCTVGGGTSVALCDNATGSSWEPSTSGGGGGGGDAAAFAAVDYSSTPLFTPTSNTADSFSFTLTGDATPTIATPATGERVAFNICQDAFGGHVFTWPFTWTSAAPVPLTPTACISEEFYWDGINAWLIGASATGAVQFGTSLAPTGNPAANSVFVWNDSINKAPSARDENGIIYSEVQTVTGAPTFAVPQIVAKANYTAQTATLTFNLLTSGLTTGDYVLNDYLTVITADSGATIDYTVSWADESPTPEVVELDVASPITTGVVSVIGFNSTPTPGTALAIPLNIHAVTGTPITVTITITGRTTLVYSYHAALIRNQ